jgi:cysteine desulfurase
MRPFERDICANAGGAHREAVAARTALEGARASIAQTFVTTNQNIIFTSGGTESNNLAIVGTIERAHEDGRAYADMEIISTTIEHPSVLEPVRMLEKKGVVVRYVPVDAFGRISKNDVAKMLTPKTVLVTFAYANSEIGTVQDVKALSRVVRLYRTEHTSAFPYVHIDASQAPLWLPCRMDSLGVDMMTVDAGKCYGPKGAGVLALRGDVRLTPVIRGGSQEGGLRPGTEDVGKAVGSALAFQYAQAGWEERAKRIATLRDGFVAELSQKLPALVVNGPWGDSRTERLPNNANVSIPGTDAEFTVIGLDHRGIACSTRSACKLNEAMEEGGSHVLRALGLPNDVVLGAIRFSLGEDTTKKELSRAVSALSEHVAIATKVPKPNF